MNARDYIDLLRPIFAGRKWIVAGGTVAGMTPLVRGLLALGAAPPFALASGLGTGDLPAEDEATWFTLDIQADTMTAAIRAYDAALANLPAAARAAIDRYDPEGTALVVGQLWLDHDEIGGRRVYAPRPPRWRALEDKVTIDALWDALSIARAPSAIVPVERAALRAAAQRLDRGTGTVWAGDARAGFHGGAAYVRWVRNDDDAAAAEALFTEACDRVRVMPFLEGIPCSIHGIVCADGVIAVRPVEMMTLRRQEDRRFVYAGCATFWDPRPDDRAYMRALAVRVGEALRARVGYRGAFTVDGVMSEDGFLPTELNPRAGAGIAVLGRSLPELPLSLLAKVAQVSEPVDLRPVALERVIVEATDARRAGGGWAVIAAPCTGIRERVVVCDDEHYRLARAGEVPEGVLATGPSDIGTFVSFFPRPTCVPVGPSIAPRVVDAFALADRELGTSLGRLQPARAVR